jgi:hypothetical protein
MGKSKTTVYLDTDVLIAAKAVALASRRTDSSVVEEALRLYLQDGQGETVRNELDALLARVSARSDLDEDSAMAIAVAEVRAERRTRRSETGKV